MKSSSPLAGFLALFLVAQSATAQIGQESLRVFAGPADEFTFALRFDSAGNAYQVGETTSFGAVNEDPLLLKYSATGSLLWARTWVGIGDGDVEGFDVGPAGDVFISGTRLGASPSNEDAFLLRCDSNGVVQWAKAWDGSSADNLDGLTLFPPSAPVQVFCAGETTGPGTGRDVLLQSYDLAGLLLWSFTWSGPAGSYEGANAVAEDAAHGRLYAAGHYGAAGLPSGWDALLLRVDLLGNVVWARTWDRGGCDDAYNVAVDGNGDVYITGSTRDSPDCEAPGAKVFVAKFDPSGALLWDGVFSQGEIEGGGLAVDLTTGDVYLSGGTLLTLLGVPNVEGWIAKLTSSGTHAWTRTWGGPGDDAIIVNWRAGRLFGSGETSSCSPSLRSCDASTYTDPAAVVGMPAGSRAATSLSLSNLPLTVGSPASTSCAGLDAVMVTFSLADTGTPYCFGNGTGTPCPCGNAGCAREGCRNSTGRGADLQGSGAGSISADSLVLHGSGMTNASCLYFQGTTQTNGGAGATFGDGLRCAGGSVIRLGTKLNVSGNSQYPDAGDVPVSVRGAVILPGVRTYQCWYRNAAAFCQPETFNLSNGLLLTWSL